MSASAAAARRPGWSVAVSLLLVLAWEASGGDLAAMQAFAGPDGFVLRDAWLTRTLLHDGGRWVAGAMLLAWAITIARPGADGPGRAERAHGLGIALACLLLVPGLKRLSATSCPWELADFGSRFPYVPHWLPGVSDGGPGHCFPSGHAVAAFAFFGLYFLWRPYRPRLARSLLAGVLLAGAAFGWAQVARGAHFPSHVLWSGWLCWALAVAAQRLRPGGRLDRNVAPAGGSTESGHRQPVPRDLVAAGDPDAGAARHLGEHRA